MGINQLLPNHVMNLTCFLTLFVFVVVFGLLIWEKLPRISLVILGAIVMVVLGTFDIPKAISFVNWETICFLWGMFILEDILTESGFFKWIAYGLAKHLNYRPLRIFLFFPLLSFFLSAFINSITVMIF